MLHLIGLVVSIGLVDSLNPTTVAPALYFAAGDRPRHGVAGFTLGVFTVTLLGGVVLLLGPGKLVLALVPHPARYVRYVLQLVAGGVLLGGAALLWRYREQLAKREVPTPREGGRSSVIAGGSIAAIELPTAFPYFAAIAAVVAADLSIGRELILIAIYNVCFVLPLLAILATLAIAGDDAERILASGRRLLERNWPVVLAVLAALAGAFVMFLGITGLVGTRRGGVGRFARRLRGLTHP